MTTGQGLDRAVDEFSGVLHDLESVVNSCHHADPGLTDWDVQAAYEAMIRAVRATTDYWAPPEPRLNERALAVYRDLEPIVAWRLGRATLDDERGRPVLCTEVIGPDDMTLCLKRLVRSLKLWNKQGGRQGYLNYIEEFLEKGRRRPALLRRCQPRRGPGEGRDAGRGGGRPSQGLQRGQRAPVQDGADLGGHGPEARLEHAQEQQLGVLALAHGAAMRLALGAFATHDLLIHRRMLKHVLAKHGPPLLYREDQPGH